MTRAAISIQNDIKKIMSDNGITYRQIAEKMGCTYQNVWNKLNNRPEPTFTALRHIVNAMGYDFGVLPDEPDGGTHVDAESIFRSAEEADMSYSSVVALLEASKVHIFIKKTTGKII